MTDMTTTNDVRARITHTSHRMLDAIDLLLDRLAPPKPERPAPPPIVRRRQIANITRAFEFCPRSLCRRSGCCRGEPLHCLQMVVTLLPPDAFDGILTRRRRQRRPRDQSSFVPAKAGTP